MKKIFPLFLIFIMIISQTGCEKQPDKVTKTSYYMDTVCTIDIYDMEDFSNEKALAVIDDAFQLCADYERLISATFEDSDIYRINHAGGAPVQCSQITVDILKKGLEYCKLSGGRFDITIGKATDLWDFHGENPDVPAAKALADAVKAVDYRQIVIDGNTVTMNNPEGEINLGGIGKGCIADEASRLLIEKGVTSAVIDFGHNIVTIGDKSGKPFKIGVEKPFEGDSSVVGYVEAANKTLVTSGIYERCFEKDGVLYHHILDPKNGYPVESDVAGVTILGEEGTSGDCDSLATICLILGVDDGLELIEKTEGFEALFIDKDGNLTKTDGFDSFHEM